MGPEICPPHKIPGDGEAAGLATSFENHETGRPCWGEELGSG